VSPADEPPTLAYLNRTLWAVGIATAIVLAVGLGVSSFIYATELFFLIFTSILFAIVLNRISRWVALKTPLSRGWALCLVLLILLAAFVGGGFFFGMQIREKIVQASKQFDEAAAKADELLQNRPLIRSVAAKLPLIGPTLEQGQTVVPPSMGGETNSSSENDSAEPIRGDGGDAPANPNSSPPGNEGEIEEGNFTPANAESVNAESGNPEEGNVEDGSSPGGMPSVGRVTAAVIQTFSTAFGIAMNLLIVLAVTIFLATEPKLYRNGLIRLFPKPRRARFADLLDRLESTLWHWALGRMMTMAITGTATGAILWFLDVPLPFLMGLITGLLAFIPNIGGLIAVTLASLLALPQGFSTVAWVIGLYCGMQLVESYVLTPLIQKRQVSLPPALLIGFQAFMGLVFGFLGLMVASPLLAAGMVIVNQLYIKDALGDHDAPEMRD
jgi:predicted PurR-regulated permease PerM